MEIWLEKTSKLQITEEACCLAEESSQLERWERERIHTILLYPSCSPEGQSRRNHTILIQVINTKYGKHLCKKVLEDLFTVTVSQINVWVDDKEWF